MTRLSAATRTVRDDWRAIAASVVAGTVTGLFGAYAYATPVLKPLSHTFGVWLLLVALLTARTTLPTAMVRATAALLLAVTAFYVGKEFTGSTRFPDSEFSLNPGQLGLWWVLAVAAGIGLAAAFHRIGSQGWPGAAATAAAVGLLMADVARRTLDYHRQAPVLIVFGVLAILVVVLRAGTTHSTQLLRTAILVPTSAGLGFLLVSTPDLLEQLVFIGFRSEQDSDRGDRLAGATTDGRSRQAV